MGPVIFTLYTQPLVDILKGKYGMRYHFYADDTQLYISGNVNEISNLLQVTEKCIEDVKIWMTSNKLKLNDDKTEVMLIRNNKTVIELPEMTLNIYNNIISLDEKVKNLGVVLDHNMSMIPFVNLLSQNLYFQLRKISSIRKYLSDHVTKQLVTSLILSKLDYCNSLLAGLPNDTLNRLQSIQNNAARLISRTRKTDHITPILKDLHWLPVKERIVYKICMTVFKCINNLAPIYLTDFIELYTPARNLRSSLDQTYLQKPLKKNYKFYGYRSLSYVGPNVWNQLPLSIREISSLPSFKARLKHHLFLKSYIL